MKSYRQIWTSAGSSHGQMKSCTTYALSQPEIYTTHRDNRKESFSKHFSCLKPRWTFPSDAASYSSSEEGFSWAQCNVNLHALLKFIQESKDQIIPNCPSGLTIMYSRPQFPHMLALMWFPSHYYQLLVFFNWKFISYYQLLVFIIFKFISYYQLLFPSQYYQ